MFGSLLFLVGIVVLATYLFGWLGLAVALIVLGLISVAIAD